MKYALNLNTDGRILSATFEEYASAEAILVDALPEGNIADYLYIDGNFVHDPLPVHAESEVGPTANERIEALEAAVTMLCMPDMEV